MGLSRWFQNLIDKLLPGTKSLFSADLTRQLFGNTATPPSATGDSSSEEQTGGGEAAALVKMNSIRLPRPTFTSTSRFYVRSDLYEPWPCKIQCFPLAGRTML